MKERSAPCWPHWQTTYRQSFTWMMSSLTWMMSSCSRLVSSFSSCSAASFSHDSQRESREVRRASSCSTRKPSESWKNKKGQGCRWGWNKLDRWFWCKHRCECWILHFEWWRYRYLPSASTWFQGGSGSAAEYPGTNSAQLLWIHMN